MPVQLTSGAQPRRLIPTGAVGCSTLLGGAVESRHQSDSRSHLFERLIVRRLREPWCQSLERFLDVVETCLRQLE